MAELTPLQLLSRRSAFVLAAFVIITVHLLPLDTRPTNWAPPDLLLAMTLVWVARRPDYLPVLVVAVIFLMTDLLFQRPPGLWAALVVVLTETLRNRRADFRSMPFPLEWVTMALGIVGITLANRLVLGVVAVPQAPLRLTMIQMVLTIAIYPAIALLAHLMFGVSRPASGQAMVRGHRI